MPHVTFVHGIGNKPPAEQLRGIWRGALAANGLDLDARGVSSSMVYWADLLNAKPLAESQLEAADDPELATVPDVGMLWAVRAQGEEALFVERLAHAIGYEDPAARAQVFEAWGPAGWPTQRLMELFLRDVHHYLFDVEFSPRPDETYRIRQEVRKRTIEALTPRLGAVRPARSGRTQPGHGHRLRLPRPGSRLPWRRRFLDHRQPARA